jgi:drug/metabolite transporter (DMT)-like permease
LSGLHWRLGRWLSGQAYLLLVLTALLWGGNAVASKLAVGEVSPMALTTLRWLVACGALAIVARRPIAAQWRELMPWRGSIVLMGALGFTAFNALFYAAAHHTSAVNLTIMQGSMPILVLIGSRAAFGTRISWVQVVGMAATLAGVALTASHGNVATLRDLDFNIGDVWMLLACVLYAGYTLGLRNRPPVAGIVYFAALAGVACMTSLPLLAIEVARGTFQWPTPTGIAIIVYVGLFPSLVSQLTFMRAVELIGPGRAGLFINLVPVFGALLAVLVLGEPFAPYQAVALAMVLGGIYVAERLKPR